MAKQRHRDSHTPHHKIRPNLRKTHGRKDHAFPATPVEHPEAQDEDLNPLHQHEYGVSCDGGEDFYRESDDELCRDFDGDGDEQRHERSNGGIAII